MFFFEIDFSYKNIWLVEKYKDDNKGYQQHIKNMPTAKHSDTCAYLYKYLVKINYVIYFLHLSVGNLF